MFPDIEIRRISYKHMDAIKLLVTELDGYPFINKVLDNQQVTMELSSKQADSFSNTFEIEYTCL